MSGDTATRSARFGRLRRWLAVVVVLVLALTAFHAAGGSRQVARGAWNFVGLHRVERHAPALRAAAAESGVDANLLAAVMFVESGGRVDALSSAGAMGLLQLMDSSAGDAARKLGLPKPTAEELLSDAELNTRLGAVHLAWLIQHEGPDLERVLVAYNAGRTKVMRWIRRDGSYEAWRARQVRDGDSQVLAYARRVLALKDQFAERGKVVAPAEGSE